MGYDPKLALLLAAEYFGMKKLDLDHAATVGERERGVALEEYLVARDSLLAAALHYFNLKPVSDAVTGGITTAAR